MLCDLLLFIIDQFVIWFTFVFSRAINYHLDVWVHCKNCKGNGINKIMTCYIISKMRSCDNPQTMETKALI